ncbi:MAG: hypothetical protein QNJ40_04575 [Xanthomonadales bacterium]|nr:hypothetical protein [Xanthomonadales bacterium]
MHRASAIQGLCVLLGLLLCQSAGAVRLSIDNSGEVLLFPLFLTGDGFQTVFEIRNRDSQGKALRFVTKDPVNGRPTQSINVYLKPNDSWSGALFDPETETTTLTGATARLRRWTDDSCTFPTADTVSADGLPLSDQEFTEDLGDLIVPTRLAFGFVEVYEMGTLDPALVSDCDAIAQRWDSNGVWGSGSDEARNADIGEPTGGIEGYAVIINTESGRAHQYEALALADFRDAPLHTAPGSGRRPNLSDVQPAESRILETVEFGNRTLLVERVSTWSASPVNAIDALLMTVSARTDYSTSSQLRAVALTVLTFPTRPYHSDHQGYYLDSPDDRSMAPFRVSVPPQAGESLQDNKIAVTAINRKGESFELAPFSNATNCDLINGTVSLVFMTSIIGFDYTCEYYRAEFRVATNAQEGEVKYSLQGEIQSDEGHVYKGLPVYGFVIQSLLNANIDLGGGQIGIANYGWIRALKSERVVTDPDR